MNFSLTTGNTNPQGIADPGAIGLLPSVQLTSDTDFDGDVDASDHLKGVSLGIREQSVRN